MKYNPKISVVMSAYNSAQFIEDSIKSILAQTFTEFEFVIINDGSTDKTFEIISKYAELDSRIRKIHKKKILAFPIL